MQQPHSHSATRRQLAFLNRQGLLITAVAIFALITAGAISYSQSKVYRASTKIVVGQGGGVFEPQFGNVIQPFTQTMSSLLQSQVVAKTVIRRLRLRETPKSLLRDVHVSTAPDSAVLEVSLDSSKPVIAVRTLDEITSVFTSLVRKKLGRPTGQGQQALPLITATVFDPAHASSTPISPRPLRTMTIAGVLGLFLGLIFGLLREALDDKA